MYYSNYPDRAGYGHCLTLPDINYKFITILKCASTWANELLLKECNWRVNNFVMNDLSNRANLVILRDPLERWIAAIKHLRFNPSETGIKIDLDDPDKLFSNVEFDVHLHLQTKALNGLDLSNCIFFKFSPYLESNLLYFLNTNLNYNLTLKGEHSKQRNMHRNNYPLYHTISKFLETQKYRNILYQYLEPDFELYNTVKFYEK